MNMLFVLGIVKISTGPRTLHIIFNTGSTASRAHSFDAQVRTSLKSVGLEVAGQPIASSCLGAASYIAPVFVANHYMNTRISVSPVCVDIRVGCFCVHSV